MRPQFVRSYLMRLEVDLQRVALDPKHPHRLASEAGILEQLVFRSDSISRFLLVLEVSINRSAAWLWSRFKPIPIIITILYFCNDVAEIVFEKISA